MDLYELEKEKKIIESKIQSKKERIEIERSKLEVGATDYSKVMVQSSHKKDTMTDVIAVIVEMEKDIEYLETRLKQNEKEVNRLYNIYSQYKERDKQIYLEKKLLGWSNAKISVKHGGITKQYINKIVKKIKDSFH